MHARPISTGFQTNALHGVSLSFGPCFPLFLILPFPLSTIPCLMLLCPCGKSCFFATCMRLRRGVEQPILTHPCKPPRRIRDQARRSTRRLEGGQTGREYLEMCFSVNDSCIFRRITRIMASPPLPGESTCHAEENGSIIVAHTGSAPARAETSSSNQLLSLAMPLGTESSEYTGYSPIARGSWHQRWPRRGRLRSSQTHEGAEIQTKLEYSSGPESH